MDESRLDESFRSHEILNVGPIDDPVVGLHYDPFGDSKQVLWGPTTPTTVSGSDKSLGGYSPDRTPTKGLASPMLNPVHVRTNFGKRGYVPPVTPASPGRPFPPPEPRAQRDAAWDDEELPFDQMGLSHPIVRNQNPVPRVPPPDDDSLPFDEEHPKDESPSQPEMPQKGMYYSDEDRQGAYKVQYIRPYFSDNDQIRSAAPAPRNHQGPQLPRSPPKVSRRSSGTTSPIYSIGASEASTYFRSNGQELDYYVDPVDDPNYEEFGLSPGSATDTSYPRVVHPDTKEEDSLIDSKDDSRRRKLAAVQSRRSRRSHRNQVMEDDSSLEPDSLQQRAHQAFSTRNRTLQKSLQKAPSSPKNSLVPTPNDSPAKSTVSFDRNPATVHHFVKDEDEHTLDSLETDGHSLYSEYTKSVESEVEDIIKDLFFIGSGERNKPGRKFYKSRTLKNLKPGKTDRKSDDDSTFDYEDELEAIDEISQPDDPTNFSKETLSALNGEDVSFESNSSLPSRSTSDSPPKNSRALKSSAIVDEDDDPFSAVWGMVEGGVNAVSEALGITSPGTSVCKPKRRETEDAFILLLTGGDMKTGMLDKNKKADPRTDRKNKSSGAEGRISPFADHSDYATGRILSRAEEKQEDSSCSETCALDGEDALETDPRLAELAFHTARSVHEIQGLVFDETSGDELVTQLEFKVVKIGLPLGLLFQENGGGCYVAKVFPDGNAAKSGEADGVHVGDQLAAIDGRSAIKMKVDDICSLISEAENTQSIELTFLRYAGPLHTLKIEGTVQLSGKSLEAHRAETKTDRDVGGVRLSPSDEDFGRATFKKHDAPSSPVEGEPASCKNGQDMRIKAKKKDGRLFKWFARGKKAGTV